MSTSEQRALVPTLRAGNAALGIVPVTFDECYRLAQCAAASGMVPKGHDASDAGVCMTIMYGLEIGIPPMQAIQGITKINGKFCIYGDLVPAILWARGFDIEQTIEGEGDARKATCTITRPGGKKITRSFSVADAKKARLWDTREKVQRTGKNGDKYQGDNDSPWFRFPDRMLGWRALGFAKTDGAADVMRGLGIVELERDIELGRTEYSEIKTAPKKTLAELPDIPDVPAASLPEAEKAKPDLAKSANRKPDAKFLEDLDAAMAAVTDIDLLNEVHIHNDAEIEERGLQQEAADLYKKHRERVYGGMDS